MDTETVLLVFGTLLCVFWAIIIMDNLSTDEKEYLSENESNDDL